VNTLVFLHVGFFCCVAAFSNALSRVAYNARTKSMQLQDRKTEYLANIHRLLEVLPSAAYTAYAEGFITYFNQLAVEVWGQKPKLNDPDYRFCGSFKLFSIGGSPILHSQCWMALALEENKSYNDAEIVVERPDGSRRIGLIYANPVHDESGTMIGAVNIIVDITDRKKAEDAMREADRRKNEFLATLGHELRNPLASIRNGLHLMRLANHGGSAKDDDIQTMLERQVGHIVRLVDDLLDLSRITNGKIELRKEPIDIVAAVRDAVETSRPLIEERGHELTLTLPPTPVFVDGDRIRLSQVFANLLNNSAKFTEPGGQISLIVEKQGSDVVVKVCDNGVGISPDLLPHIFEMFIQANRSQGGLGIGLNLVRKLVEMHGGSVEAHGAESGQGTEFIVRMSVILPHGRSPRERDTVSRNPCPSKYRILIVDDNRASADALAQLLQMQGHDTRTAYDGVKAVEAAATFRPDVMLLDIGLPKLSGYEVARRVRQQPWGESVVLIAQTGWGQEEDKRRSQEAGCNFHIVKPIDIAALENLLARLMPPRVRGTAARDGIGANVAQLMSS
jgi:signal transduction histidine kinase/CheY-like chemotaxis protein